VQKVETELRTKENDFSLRFDAPGKVAGGEKYAADFYSPDMVWAGVKRAGSAHGRLRGIEIREAEKLPGILKVLTHKDIRGTNRQGVVRKDQPVLVDDKVRYPGDAVALVLAENREALGRALELIRIDLEPLPGVFDLEAALVEGAPRIHEDHPGGNVLLQGHLVRGEVQDAFQHCAAAADFDFQTSYQEHAYLETEAGWARLDHDGSLYLAVSTQTPFRDCREIAEALGVDWENIRLTVPPCGGAFGGKDGITVQSLLALAALHCPGRPVKMWLDREESLSAGCKRHPARLHFRLGVDVEGRFQALEARVYYDTGPYDHLGGAVMAMGLEHAGGPYRIPNIDLQAWAVYTNNPLGGPFRGFGVPQVMAALEQTIDLLAEKLNLSPLEIRQRNAVGPGDQNAAGVALTTSTRLRECLAALEAHPLWTGREAWKAAAGPFKQRGVGLACVMHGQGYGPVIPDAAAAKIELTGLGRFRIYCGVVDMGQGNSHTFLQMAGEILKQPLEKLEFVRPDTRETLPGGSASASRTTYTFGRALIDAAEELKQKIIEKAAELFGTPDLEEVIVTDSAVRHLPTGWMIPLARLSAEMGPEGCRAVRSFQAPTAPDRPTPDPALQLHGIPHLIFSYGVHLAAVEVDTLTGGLAVKKYLAVSDCGRIVNPAVFEQQIQGGIAQGLGYALTEDYRSEQGKGFTGDLSTYILPTAVDLPDMESLAVDSFEPTGPLGLKGGGEIGIDGPLPAVANALADACGVRLARNPLTAERVWRVLREKEDGSGRMEDENQDILCLER
jgi:CO/xanthine dehydrogenase Mo-binding subunit